MNKKKILLIALSVFMLILISGCSQEKQVKNAPYIASADIIANEYDYNNQYINNSYQLYKDKLIYYKYSEKQLFNQTEELQYWCIDEKGSRLISKEHYYSDLLSSEVYIDNNVYISSDKMFFLAFSESGCVLSKYDLTNDTFKEISLINSYYYINQWVFLNDKIYFLDKNYKSDDESILGCYDLKTEKYTEISTSVPCYSITSTGDIMYVNNNSDDVFKVCLYDTQSNTSTEIYQAEYDKYTTNGFSFTDNYVIVESGAFTSKFYAHNLSNGNVSHWYTEYLACGWAYSPKYAYVLVNSELDMGSEKYSIYRYEIATGESQVLTENIGTVLDIQAVNDDTVYAFVFDGNMTKLYRVTSDCKKEEVYSFKE